MVSIGDRIGEYRLVKILGRGSFGVVYLAEHSKTKLKVAIKLLQPELLNPEGVDFQKARENFLEEVRILKRLRHPYILPILDDGFHNDAPYLVTEYAPKGSLADRLKSQPAQPMPIEEAMTIISQVGLALYHAHSQRATIVHRDIKPANILFNARGDALLADFGIAIVLLNSGRTELVDIAGTHRYMAPEQFDGLVSKKIDQFALGCVAYELVTGYHPFKRPDWWSFNEKPLDPTVYNPRLPLHMAKAILKAIEKNRTDRYDSVFAFINILSPAKIKEHWLREGDDHYAAQRYEEARSAYEQAIRFDRDYTNAYIGRGKALYALGRYKAALGAYTRAAALDSGNVSAYYGKGITLRKLKRYEEALSAFEQVILLDPDKVDIYNDKGIVLYHLGRYEEALAAYEQAVFSSETILVFGSKDIDNYNRRACTHLRLEQYKEALALYEYVIRLDGRNAVAFYGKGVALYNLHRCEEAITAYKQATQLGSGSVCAYAYTGMGMALNELKRHEEALAAYEQAMQHNFKSIEISIAKGVTLSMLKRYEEALEAYERAIQLDPKRASAYAGKGFVLRMLGHYEEALKAYEQALLLDPSHTEISTNIFMSKAIVLWKLKLYTAALEAYEQAILLDPHHVTAYTSKGLMLEEMQRYEEALLAYKQSIGLAPDDPSVYNSKGRVLKELNRYQEALSAYELAIQLDSSYGDAYIGKGQVLKMLKPNK